MTTSGILKREAMLGVLLATGSALAQADSIATDRPDFVESSDVVSAARQQIEVGLSYERDATDGVTATAYSTPTLLRIGLTGTWEARIETDGFARVRVSGEGFSKSDSGVTDAAIGAKWHFHDAAGSAPSMALLMHLDLPSGSKTFRGVGVRPSLRMVAEWELSEMSSLGVMPGVMFDRNDDGRFTSGILAATYGRQLSAVLKGFVEIAGQQLASKADGGNIVTYDVGASYLLDNDTQLDAVVNVGANADSPDWSVGVGFSHRFGKAN